MPVVLEAFWQRILSTYSSQQLRVHRRHAVQRIDWSLGRGVSMVSSADFTIFVLRLYKAFHGQGHYRIGFLVPVRVASSAP